MTRAWKEKKAKEAHHLETICALYGEAEKNRLLFGMTHNPFVATTNLPKFKVIYGDPPWRYQNYGMKGHGAVRAHYPTMDWEELANYRIDLGFGHHRIAEYADPEGCALVLWGTSPKLAEALALGEHWGFEFITKLFCWDKTYQAGNDYCGLGNYTRSSTEDAWLFKIGKITVQDKNVRQILRAPVREHSRKPDECYELIERLWGPACGQYLELFSRTSRRGWTSHGFDAGKFGVL